MKESDLQNRVELVSRISTALKEATRHLPHQAVKLQQDIERALGAKRTIKSRASRFKK